MFACRVQQIRSSDFLKKKRKGAKTILLGPKRYYLCLNAGINRASLSPVSQALLQEDAIFTLFIMDERRGSQMEKMDRDRKNGRRPSVEGFSCGQMKVEAMRVNVKWMIRLQPNSGPTLCFYDFVTYFPVKPCLSNCPVLLGCALVLWPPS